MNPTLTNILEAHSPGLPDHLLQALEEPIYSFRADMYPRLCQLDSLIPGIGMQYALWSETTPHYPFSSEFDGIVRPLRYVPYNLASGMDFRMIARTVALYAGAHLEECVKAFSCVKLGHLRSAILMRRTLGSLARHLQPQLGNRLSGDIIAFCDISWNQAKHQYADGLPKSVIPFIDALAAYFAARMLGADVLRLAGLLESVVHAIEKARANGQIYITGELGAVGKDDRPWPVWGKENN
jgi:hypothetical protein